MMSTSALSCFLSAQAAFHLHADSYCGPLMQHKHIKGLGAKLERFTGIVDDIKARPYDLLDFSVTQFDRDFLEFNVHINELELALKVCPHIPQHKQRL